MKIQNCSVTDNLLNDRIATLEADLAAARAEYATLHRLARAVVEGSTHSLEFEEKMKPLRKFIRGLEKPL